MRVLLLILLALYASADVLPIITNQRTQGSIVEHLWVTDTQMFIRTSKNYVYYMNTVTGVFKNLVTENVLVDSDVMGGVKTMYQSPMDSDYILFVGTKTIHWTTDDGGNTFHKHEIGANMINIRFSPVIIKQFIFTTESKPGCMYTTDTTCNIQLMVTDDITRGVDLVAKYVERFAYHDDAIVYVKHRTESGKQVVKVEDVGYDIVGCYNDVPYDMYMYQHSDPDHRLIGADVSDFILVNSSDYLLGCRKNKFVNYDFAIQKLSDIVFFEEDFSGQYLHVDKSNVEGQAFSCTSYSPMSPRCELVRSYSDGSALVLSLPQVAVSPRTSHMEALAVPELPKYVLANTESLFGDKHTMISKDGGLTWSLLAAPPGSGCVDGQGEYEKCALNLHLEKQFDPGDWKVRPTSHRGYMLATGSVGWKETNDPTESSTWLSSDGGVTWNNVTGDPTFQTFVDAGAMVLVNSWQDVTQILVSLDDGNSWTSYGIGLTQDIDGMDSSPDLGTTVFIWGGLNAIHVQLAPLWTSNCTESDYEEFYHLENDCVNGRKEMMMRRKQGLPCRNNDTYPNPFSICLCKHDDYECNVNQGAVQIDRAGTVCKPGAAWPDFSASCAGSGTYYIPSYYQLLDDTVCVVTDGAVVHDGTTMSCPKINDKKKSSGWVTFFVILAGCAAIGGGVFAYKSNVLRPKWESWISNWRTTHDIQSHGENEHLTRDTDEQFRTSDGRTVLFDTSSLKGALSGESSRKSVDDLI